MKTNQQLQFVERTSPESSSDPDLAWVVSLVGWDEVTRQLLVRNLEDVKPMGRPIKFVDASNSDQIIAQLADESDLAVVLFNGDTPSATSGAVAIAQSIRRGGFPEPRLIIHANEEQMAPHLSAGERDHIGYTGFAGSKFLSTRIVKQVMASAILSYRQINHLNRSHRMLRRIAQTTARMIDQSGMADCAAVAARATVTLLSGKCGFLCFARRDSELSTKPYFGVGCGTTCTPSVEENEAIARAIDSRRHVFEPDHTVIFVPLHDDPNGAAIYVKGAQLGDEVTYRLIEILVSQIESAMNRMSFTHRIEYLILHDEATGMPNHRAIEREITRRLGVGDLQSVINVITVDTYSEIEASFGEEIAHGLMRAVANRFMPLRGAYVGRIGSSQLIVVGPRLGPAGLPVSAQYVAPVRVRDFHLPVSLSIGMIEMPVVPNAEEGIRLARIASRDDDVRSLGAIRVYDQEMALTAKGRLDRVSALKNSIDAMDHFEVHYQPQFNTISKELIGAEALLRWNRTEFGMSTADMIALAETSGLIRQIGQIAVIEGICQAARWYENGHSLVVAVNLSAAQIVDSEILRLIEVTLIQKGLPAHLFEVELTETAASTQARVREAMADLHEMGVRVAIDDFGTGYSSLQRLADQRFDRIKIDRDFVAKAPQSKAHRSVCKMAIDLANSLGIAVLAEGVETHEQEALMVKLGCREAQGFLYGRAVPAQDFEAWFLRPGGSQRNEASIVMPLSLPFDRAMASN